MIIVSHQFHNHFSRIISASIVSVFLYLFDEHVDHLLELSLDSGLCLRPWKQFRYLQILYRQYIQCIGEPTRVNVSVVHILN